MTSDDPTGGWQRAAPVARRADRTPPPAGGPGRGPRRRPGRRSVMVPRGLVIVPVLAVLACAGGALLAIRHPDAPSGPGAPRVSTFASTALDGPAAADAGHRSSRSARPTPTSSATRSAAPSASATGRATRRARHRAVHSTGATTGAATARSMPPAQPLPTSPPTHRTTPQPTHPPTAPPRPTPTQTRPVDPNAPPTPSPTGPVAGDRVRPAAARSGRPSRSDRSDRPDRSDRSDRSDRRGASQPRLRRRLGFHIRHTGLAGGDWIGSYHVGARTGYLYQPGRRPVARFRPHTGRTADVGGRRGPTRRQTEMAAWILAAYGSYHSAIQAAAVDVSVDSLLARRPWHVGARLGKARLAQSGHGAEIRAMARTILSDARSAAGPVRLAVSAQPAPAGGQAVVTLALTNTRTRAGLAGYRVRVYAAGHRRSVTTDRHGRATLYYGDVPAGTTSLRAHVSGIRDWRLTYRVPVRRTGTRAAIANRHVTLTARTRLVGVTQQTVSIARRSAVSLGSRLGGTYTVTGGQDSRQVDIAAYGPFDSADAAACTGSPAYTAPSRTIAADGTYSLPGYTPKKSGFYVWSVQVEANASSTATSACGAAEAVRAVARLAQLRDSVPRSASPGEALRPQVRVSGFDRSEPHTLTARLFGPYPSAAKATCAAAKRLRNVSASVDGNGVVTLPPAHVRAADGPGYYAFSSVLDPGPLVTKAATGCGLVVHVG